MAALLKSRMSADSIALFAFLGLIVLAPVVAGIYFLFILYQSLIVTGSQYRRAKETLIKIFPDVVFHAHKPEGFFGWLIGESLTGRITNGSEVNLLSLQRESEGEFEMRPLSINIMVSMRKDDATTKIFTHNIAIYRTPTLLHRPPISTGRNRYDKGKSEVRNIESEIGDVTIAMCPFRMSGFLLGHKSFSSVNNEALLNDAKFIDECAKFLESRQVLYVTIGGMGSIEVCCAWDKLDQDPIQLRATVSKYSERLTQIRNSINETLS